MSIETAIAQLRPPQLLLASATYYLIGFPLLVAVTYDNTNGDMEFFGLPDLDLYSAPSRIGIDLVPVHGGSAVHIAPRRPEEAEGGTPLHIGESRRMTFDLSNFGISLVPGTYRLIVTLREGSLTLRSNEVSLELAAAKPDDEAEARRIRAATRTSMDTGAWGRFLASDHQTAAPKLSDEARRQLALHLFLHHALHSTEPIATLDEMALSSVGEPSLQSEVEALRYEILSARRDPTAEILRSELINKAPGMRHRVEGVERTIADGRNRFDHLP